MQWPWTGWTRLSLTFQQAAAKVLARSRPTLGTPLVECGHQPVVGPSHHPHISESQCSLGFFRRNHGGQQLRQGLQMLLPLFPAKAEGSFFLSRAPFLSGLIGAAQKNGSCVSSVMITGFPSDLVPLWWGTLWTLVLTHWVIRGKALNLKVSVLLNKDQWKGNRQCQDSTAIFSWSPRLWEAFSMSWICWHSMHMSTPPSSGWRRSR